MGFTDVFRAEGMASASPADCLLGLKRNGFNFLRGCRMQTALGGHAGNLWQVFTCMVQMRSAVFGSAARCAGVGDPDLGGGWSVEHVMSSPHL